jgi:hypothetical protein
MSETPTERLIAALEQGGRESEAGTWSLDEAAARRKLAEYRLADPRVWLCTIVEAAVVLGAPSIRVDRKLDGLHIAFGGLTPPLEQLFASVVGGDTSDPRSRAARKLAIAFETMLERAEVASVEVAAGGVRLTLTKDERRHESCPPTDRTKIVVRRGLNWPEIDLLAERGRYARASILTTSVTAPEAKPLSLGLEQALVDMEATHARWPIVHEGRTVGWLGHRASADVGSKLVIVSAGITAELVHLRGKGEVAIVEWPLAKDLGENRVVRNEAFERVLTLVEAARTAHPRTPPPQPPPAREQTELRPREPSFGLLLIQIVTFAAALLALLPVLCDSDQSSTRAPQMDLSAATLRGHLAHADTFARCKTHTLPGGRLSQMHVVVLGSSSSPGSAKAFIMELNYDPNFELRHGSVARCIEARVGSLATELQMLDPAAWDGLDQKPKSWKFQY